MQLDLLDDAKAGIEAPQIQYTADRPRNSLGSLKPSALAE